MTACLPNRANMLSPASGPSLAVCTPCTKKCQIIQTITERTHIAKTAFTKFSRRSALLLRFFGALRGIDSAFCSSCNFRFNLRFSASSFSSFCIAAACASAASLCFFCLSSSFTDQMLHPLVPAEEQILWLHWLMLLSDF